MRPLCVGLSAFLLSGGCGSALFLAISRASPRPPEEVYECVRNQIPAIGFTQTSHDDEAHRLTARRFDYETRLSDTQFRRMVDRLTIEVGGSPESGATLRVEAHSFAELATYRGPTEVERSASAAAKAAAQTLLDTCGS